MKFIAVYLDHYSFVVSKSEKKNVKIALKRQPKSTDIFSYFSMKYSLEAPRIFFYFSMEYSLEAPREGASNEYPRHMFSWRNKKKYYLDTALTDLEQ